MHKDELLELHSKMFDPYDELEVTPDDVHKSKSEHKHAVFVLGNALANVMSEDEFSDAGRIGKRMAELAEDAESKL
ncbi:metal-binding protein [Halobacteriales archaeon QH_10_70_21]|nr:MAG: metal-binding protein [Halobacteriales archaeon QH_10_70_21]